MAKKTEERYVVTCTRPEGVSISEMNEYIKSAVRCWSRGGDPMAPLWEVGDHPVKVKRMKPDEDIFRIDRSSPFEVVPPPGGAKGNRTH